MAQTTLTGVVTSVKRDKTITVSIASRETHPLYRKQYTKTRKYTAHDEKNAAGLGDKVEITACRPYSKTKTYKLVKIIEKAHGIIELKDEVVAAANESSEGHPQSRRGRSDETRNDGLEERPEEDRSSSKEDK